MSRRPLSVSEMYFVIVKSGREGELWRDVYQALDSTSRTALGAVVTNRHRSFDVTGLAAQLQVPRQEVIMIKRKLLQHLIANMERMTRSHRPGGTP
jgi:hypothetical protein